MKEIHTSLPNFKYMAFDAMEECIRGGRAEPQRETVTLHLLLTVGQSKELLMNKMTDNTKTQYRWGIPYPRCL